VNPAPAPVITQSGTILSSSFATGNQWYLNGSIMAGETLQDLNLTQNGTYSVTVSDTSGCTGTSADFIVTSIGIAQLNNEVSISVYPNPVYNSMQITYSLVETENVSIEIINTIGQKVQSVYNGKQTSGTYSFTVDVHQLGLSEGVYFIKFETEHTVKLERIVVLK
jgi:hypothetical protein